MKQTSLAYQYASAQPVAPDQTPWRGYIDGWDPLTGIHGWALTTDAPSTPLKLELLVGDVALSTIETGRSRPDLAGLLGVAVVAGFCFTPDIFPRLARLSPRRAEHAVNVRIAGTQVLLRGREPLPTVARFVELWRDALLAAQVQHRDSLSKADQLRVRLSMMRTESEAFRALPLRPTAENEIGHIDALYLDAQSLVWFTGWIARDFDAEFPAIIVDRQKHAAGVAILLYERQDLASRFVGVIGVIDTGWAPPALTGDFFIYVGRNAGRQLRASARTKLLGAEAFLAIYRQAAGVASGGNVDAMSALLSSGDNWLPGSAAAAGMAADAALDRLLMIVGFGCIAEGWSVSPAKRVQTFQLKVGDCVLVADDDATYFRPRPDLASVAGDEAALSRAGFVSMLRGELPHATSGANLLRVIYDDGTSVVKRLEPRLMRQLDCIVDSAEVLRLYPSLRHERCYPALLDAIERQLVARVRWPAIIAVNPCKRLVVLTLPTEPNNVRLCFDYIARLRRFGDPNIGICLVARRSLNLPQTRVLFEEFRPREPNPLSLVCVEEEFDSFAALPFVLSKHNADRFVYVDGGLILTQRGWQEAVETLGMPGHAIRYFQIVDDAGSPDRIHGALSAACFQWTTAAFLQWLSSARRFVRGVFQGNGLPDPVSGRDVRPGAAMYVERVASSRLADMIDEDLLAGRHYVASHA